MKILEIKVCPSTLAEGFSTYSPHALKALFDGKTVSHVFDFESPSSEGGDGIAAMNNASRLSLSGAQPKFGLVLDGNRLRYSRPDEQSGFIMKPGPVGYHIINREYCAANENLTMQMASQVYGIETAENGLCFFPDGEAAYITRRFDVYAGGKYAQEDFASLMGLTRNNGGSDFKYENGSYEECADIISRYVKTARIDILRFFRIVLFNFVTLNDDAHLKNFSLVNNGKEYRLSPAYDLINTALHIREPRIFALGKGLFREGMELNDTHSVGPSDFVEFGRRIGLPLQLIEKEIAAFAVHSDRADSLIERSYLSDELKEQYMLLYHYRQSLLRG